jgi:hypothetical protein
MALQKVLGIFILFFIRKGWQPMHICAFPQIIKVIDALGLMNQKSVAWTFIGVMSS